MSDYQNKELCGGLFKNDKGDNPNRPDYRGDFTCNGVKYRLSAWIRQGPKGAYMSLEATAPTVTHDDDIPF